MKLLFTFFLIFNVIAISTEKSLGADLEAGEQIFTANCAACHLGGNNLIIPDKTLQSDVLERNEMNSVQAITTQVKNGKNAMPAFGGRLADEDIDNVANYVLEQSVKGW